MSRYDYPSDYNSYSRGGPPSRDSYYDSRYEMRRGPYESRLDDSRYLESNRGMMSDRKEYVDRGRPSVYRDYSDWDGRSLPPHRRNLDYINRDATLGGEMFKPSGAPLSKFATETKRTPWSRTFERVIPWDNKNKDYVYGAIYEEVLMGRISRRELKRRIDGTRPGTVWPPDKNMLLFLIIAVAILLIGLFIGILLMIIFWDEFKDYWWVWLIIAIVLIILAIIIVVIGVSITNSAIKKRETAILRECDHINRSRLHDSGIRLVPGPAAAYISVFLERGAYERWYESRYPTKSVIRNPGPTVMKEKIVRDENGRIVDKSSVVNKPEQPGIIRRSGSRSPVRSPRASNYYDSNVPAQQRTYYDPNRSVNLMA